MRRRLLNIASAVSLLLCLATVALCVRGFVAYDRWRYVKRVASDRGVSWLAMCGKGGVSLSRVTLREESPSTGLQLAIGLSHISTAPLRYPRWGSASANATHWAEYGFEFVDQDATLSRWNKSDVELVQWGVTAPIPSLTVATAALPVAWLVAWLRKRRTRTQGCCRKCGYNLTANTSGVCSECGTPVPSKPEVIA